MDRFWEREKTARERGSVTILATGALLLVAFAGGLAVDYGFLQYKRAQLQTAADASALAGAQVLLQYGSNLDGVTGVSVDFGQRNLTSQDSPNLAVRASDVAFYKDGTPSLESPNQVEVAAGRTGTRGNPVDLFLGGVLGQSTADVSASARAALFCARSTNCIKPFSPPAKFEWDDNCDCGSKSDNNKYNNNGKFDMACACEASETDTDGDGKAFKVLGYGPDDLGATITLKLADNADSLENSHYFIIDLPPVNRGDPSEGGDRYREMIAHCTDYNNVPVYVGDTLRLNPGGKVGPTRQGIDDLIDQDPGATWNPATSSIEGSSFADPMQSPRVVLIPFYDPAEFVKSGRDTVTVEQLGAVFVTERNAKEKGVDGVFIRAMGVSPTREPGNCDTDTVAVYGASLARDSSRMTAQ